MSAAARSDASRRRSLALSCLSFAGALVAAWPVSAAAPPPAAAPPLLNAPSVSGWTVYGDGQKHALRRDADVQGGGAMRIDVKAATEHVYDIGASNPVTGAIAKGDRIVVAFYARLLPAGPAGTLKLAGVLQQATSPFAPVIAGSVEVDGTWKLVSFKGVAAADHPANSMNVALQLGGAPHSIDLGPMFVMKIAVP